MRSRSATKATAVAAAVALLASTSHPDGTRSPATVRAFAPNAFSAVRFRPHPQTNPVVGPAMAAVVDETDTDKVKAVSSASGDNSTRIVTAASTAHSDNATTATVSVAVSTPNDSRGNNDTQPMLDDEELMQLIADVEDEAEKTAAAIMEDDTCEPNPDDPSMPIDELCVDDIKKAGMRQSIKTSIGNTLRALRGVKTEDDSESESDNEDASPDIDVSVFQGDVLEEGWTTRGKKSALRRNAEVWKFALKCVFRVLKPRTLRKKGASEDDIKQAQTDAATFIRDGLLTLGPTFVKLGQVVSTRTDVLPKTYTDVLKTLQDDVPPFSGEKAKQIVSKELGKPFDEVFTDFSDEPLKSASLGQVHTAYYKGQKVAVKVQRAGLKELFDIDLKNLKKLAVLLDKFDPKTDGADRDWVSIYEESERLLYLEIDYLNEADNCQRFARDFKDIDYVRIPKIYREVTTPRVLTMEFVESFKLTDVEKVDELGLDRKELAKRTAEVFLRQVVETSYFHCDPHPGNLCADEKGNLVYYDFGMMDELKPNVREGFRTFCTALFAGGPTIDDTELAKNAKKLVNGVEQAGVLARGADRLAVEKLARYFMRTFKDNQLGKKGKNIKSAVGTDLQTLTENNVFRFPSTFTFIFRAFASVEGIGKGLDPDYDIGKLAQPFINRFIDAQKNYTNKAEKNLVKFGKATGLNPTDINAAVSSPRKIAFVEETLRAMSDGSLKIRVRSLENEKALERMSLTNARAEKLVMATLCLNLAGLATRAALSYGGMAGAAFFGLQAVIANSKIKKFDKTQAKFEQTAFDDGTTEEAEEK